jgi:hypothetical protein
MTPREMMDRFVELMNAGDLDGVEALMHPDFYEDYPQSGERIRGAANARAEIENYPGGLENQLGQPTFHGREEEWVITPNYRVVRVTDAGNGGTAVLKIHYPDGSDWWLIVIFEIKDALLYRQMTFFAEPFDPPEWRAPYAERIPG